MSAWPWKRVPCPSFTNLFVFRTGFATREVVLYCQSLGGEGHAGPCWVVVPNYSGEEGAKCLIIAKSRA